MLQKEIFEKERFNYESKLGNHHPLKDINNILL